MKDLINNHKLLFGLCLALLSYFVLLNLNSYYRHFSFVLIGVVQEMVTIPFMFFELALLFIPIKSFISTKFSVKQYPFYSLLVLTISILISWGSFFLS